MIGTKKQVVSGLLVGVIAVVALLAVAWPTYANRFSNDDFIIDASTMNTFGGSGNSTNYQMVSSGGEAIIGEGTGGSYKMGQGYVAQLTASEPYLELNVQQTGLVLHHSFDENAGTQVYDTSASKNDAQLPGDPSWTTGKVGSALSFNGSDQYVEVVDSTTLPSIEGAKTVMAWIKTTGSGSDQEIATFYDTTNSYGISLRFSSGGEIQVKVIGGARLTYEPIATANDGEWHHVVYVYSGDSNYLYFDGVEVDSSGLDPDPGATDVLCIGCSSNGITASRLWNGSLDEVKIYNRALSADEIKAEYEAQDAGKSAGLTLGTIVPGASQSVDFDAIVYTSSPLYTLTINQDHSLQSSEDSIPSIGASIASPSVWDEGTTKGLGFTVRTGADASPSWGSGNNYAALPNTATTFYSRTGATAGTKEVIGLRLRADVTSTRVAGDYESTVMITGTITP